MSIDDVASTSSRLRARDGSLAKRERAEIDRRVEHYRGGPLPDLTGRDVILVDDVVERDEAGAQLRAAEAGADPLDAHQRVVEPGTRVGQPAAGAGHRRRDAQRPRFVVRVADRPGRLDRLTERLLRLGQLAEPLLRLAEGLQRDRSPALYSCSGTAPRPFSPARPRPPGCRRAARDWRARARRGLEERALRSIARRKARSAVVRATSNSPPRWSAARLDRNAARPADRRSHEDAEGLLVEGDGPRQVAELPPHEREPAEDDADAAFRAGRRDVLERPLVRVQRLLQAADAAQRRAQVAARDRFVAGRLRDRQRFLEQLDGAAGFADARARLGQLRQRAGPRRRVAGALQPRQPALDDRRSPPASGPGSAGGRLRRTRAVG